MSLPVQIAVYNAVHTSTTAIRNNSHKEVCEACGQVIQQTSEYSAADTILGTFIVIVIFCVCVYGLITLIDWMTGY